DVCSSDLASYGAEKVYVAESAEAADYLVTPKVDALAAALQQASPAAVLVPADSEGKEVSGRLAVRTGSGLLVDAVGVRDDGTVDQSIFGGAFSVKSRAAKGTPSISLRPGSVDVEQCQSAAAEQRLAL